MQLQTRHHLKPAADRELGEGLGPIGQTFSKLQMFRQLQLCVSLYSNIPFVHSVQLAGVEVVKIGKF